MSYDGFFRQHSLREQDLIPPAPHPLPRASISSVLGPLTTVGEILAVAGQWMVIQGKDGIIVEDEDGHSPAWAKWVRRDAWNLNARLRCGCCLVGAQPFVMTPEQEGYCLHCYVQALALED